MKPRDPDCQHPGSQLLERKYALEILGCPDCGTTYQRHAQEPIDMRLFGQLRTWFGNPPESSE